MHKLKLNIFLCILFFPLFLISETIDKRLVRPDAPDIKESNAIVGPHNSSLDQAFIAQKLGLIKKCLCSLSIDITGVFTVLEELGLCDPIPLAQADVIDGAIRLDIPGFNYCFAENITGTLEITANNINVDLNDRVLFGIVNIDADEITIENGKIIPETPNLLAFNSPAVFVGSENIVLRDLLIICEDTIMADVNGRTGIENNGNKTQIINCSIKSGSANVATGIPKNGGAGIINIGNNTNIKNCFIETGFGSRTSFIGGPGGNGGIGIICNQTKKILIKNCIIKTGSGGNAGIIPGPQGGDGIAATNGSFIIKNCTVITGDGGPGLPRGNSGNGMNFTSNVQNILITECIIETGTGNNGSGLICESDTILKVHQSCITTGFGTPNSGAGIITTSTLYNEFIGLTIITGNASRIPSFIGSDGGDSGSGIEINGSGIIQHCAIKTGNGGDVPDATGGNSGTGIHASSPGGINVEVDIKECIIKVGAPGAGPESFGTAGAGIFEEFINKSTIIDTIVSNAFDGFHIESTDNLCCVQCKALQGRGNGFSLIGTSTFTITNCQSISNNGDGFFLANDSFDGHLISNQANSNNDIGINNASGDMTRHQIYNNVSSQNGTANYAGVALVENAPTVDTGFYANVI